MASTNEEIIWQADFNEKVETYWLLNGAVALLVSIIGIPLVPFWFLLGRLVTRRYLSHMRCTLTTKSIHVAKGMFIRTEKTVPLDKITDLGLVQGPIMRYLGLQAITFETAGQSSAGALIRLTGVVDTENFRQAVLKQRDHIVELLSEGRQPTQALQAPTDAAVLGEIRDSLLRIETLLKKD